MTFCAWCLPDIGTPPQWIEGAKCRCTEPCKDANCAARDPEAVFRSHP